MTSPLKERASVHSEEQLLCPIYLDVFSDPITTPRGHNYCKTCIKTDHMCVCQFCTESDHKSHQTVSLEEECEGKKIELGKTEEGERVHSPAARRMPLPENALTPSGTEAEVQQMIQERQVKIQEVQRSVEKNKKDADREMADCVQVFTALISCIESYIEPELIDVIEEKQKTTEKQAVRFIKELQHEITELKKTSSELKQLSHMIEEKQKTTEKQADGFIKELQHEITELKKRSSEPKQLSHIEDHLHLLQNFTSINTPPPTNVGTVRTSVAQLEKTVYQKVAKLLQLQIAYLHAHNTSHCNSL